MIRTVADRIASRTRPAYKGRHRRIRPKLTAPFRTPMAPGAPEGRSDEELVVIAA